jgi:CheY-like chemotaxis protein
MPTKILAIDDSKTMRLAIKITFAAEDADVTAVSKGSEAVARAKQMSADIVLVDVSLAAGEPSGYDVCQQLKADPDTASIPVLLLASSQSGVDAGKLKACGADGSITKPFETQELIDKVGEALGKSTSKPAGTQASAAAPTPPPASVVAPAAAAPSPARAPAAAPAAQASAPTSVAPSRPQVTTPTARAAAAAPAPAPAEKASAAPASAPAPAPALRLQPQPAAGAPRAAAAPARSPEAGEVAIPIAVPIPFTAASSPTPGMLARLQAAQGGALAGLDPKVAEAILALSREVLEAVVWEVVPELAEQIVREHQAKAG